jgi:hypothetical protein
MKHLFFIALISLHANFASAALQKYDYCEGTLPKGGFSTELQNYTIKAYTNEGTSHSVVIIHLNGNIDSMSFHTQLSDDGVSRSYVGFNDVTLNINCTSGGCPGELIKENRTYKVSCYTNRVDLPPPATPPGEHCRQHCH